MKFMSYFDNSRKKFVIWTRRITLKSRYILLGTEADVVINSTIGQSDLWVCEEVVWGGVGEEMVRRGMRRRIDNEGSVRRASH